MASQSTVARAAILAALVAAVGLVAYLGVEAFVADKEQLPPPSPVVTRPEPEKRALPQEATNLSALWDMAWGAARQWQKDAKLTRVYASAIHPDGTFDRATADVQFVYLSRELSAAGVSQGGSNGLRWALSQGKVSSMELKQYPAPSLDLVEPKLCDLRTMAGDSPPAEVVLDVFYVEHDGKAPVLSLFTDDRKFMVLAEPVTCAVHGRATRQTQQEAEGGAERADVDGGRSFDTAKASRQVDAVLAGASSCKQVGGPSGAGTVSVRFDTKGKVDEVSYQMGGYAGTPVGGCIEGRLRKISVSPWDTGRGFIIKRFSL